MSVLIFMFLSVTPCMCSCYDWMLMHAYKHWHSVGFAVNLCFNKTHIQLPDLKMSRKRKQEVRVCFLSFFKVPSSLYLQLKKSRKNESVTKKTSDLLLPVRTLRQSKAHGIYIVPFYLVEQSKAVSTASHDSPSHMHTCLNTF